MTFSKFTRSRSVVRVNPFQCSGRSSDSNHELMKTTTSVSYKACKHDYDTGEGTVWLVWSSGALASRSVLYLEVSLRLLLISWASLRKFFKRNPGFGRYNRDEICPRKTSRVQYLSMNLYTRENSSHLHVITPSPTQRRASPLLRSHRKPQGQGRIRL